MKIEPLISRSELQNLFLDTQKKIEATQAEEINKMVLILNELRETLKVTQSISITGFMKKYNLDLMMKKALESRGVVKHTKTEGYHEYFWTSEVEPNNQMALALFKAVDHPLFSKRNKRSVRPSEFSKEELEEAVNQVFDINISKTELEYEKLLDRAFSDDDSEGFYTEFTRIQLTNILHSVMNLEDDSFVTPSEDSEKKVKEVIDYGIKHKIIFCSLKGEQSAKDLLVHTHFFIQGLHIKLRQLVNHS
jgi:hypothetical protein